MRAWIRAVLALALLVVANAATAKIKSADELKPDKAYLLVQVEPLTIKLMGTNRIATGILFAPYDVQRNYAGPAVMALNDPISKDGKRRLFLLEIDPGTWTIAGTGGIPAALGLANTSFSLGSYHFEAKAGEMLDLGVFEPQREETDNPDAKLTSGKLIGMMLLHQRIEPLPNMLEIRPRGPGDIAIPAWLAPRPLVQPAFVYGGTFGNSLGGLVNRVDGKAGRGRAIGTAAYLSKPGQPVAEAAAVPVATP
ncbi:MAG: hypothetical protein ABI810_14855 [Sphingomonas bacterium]